MANRVQEDGGFSMDGGGEGGSGISAVMGKQPTGFSFAERSPAQDGTVQGRNSMDVDDEDRQEEKLWEEATFLRNLLPDIVWKMVLKKLDTKEDMENCSYASPYFGNFFRLRREKEVVLPKVFQILAKRYCDIYNKYECYRETDVQSIPWSRPANNRLPYLTGIWKCRLVCKKWNEAIEEIHRNEDAGHYWMPEDLIKPTFRGSRCGLVDFGEEFQVRKFLAHFETTHYDPVRQVSRKCPFLARSVRISYDSSRGVESVQGYFNAILEMLWKFGKEVHFFEFRPQNNYMYIHVIVRLFETVRQWVELMPNLKMFRIQALDDFRALPHEDLQALEQHFQINPFPHLAKLEMMGATGLCGAILNHLVNRNRQISRLQMSRIVYFNVNPAIFTDNLPKLTQLSLEIKEEIFEQFESYEFPMKLQKLHLTFWCCEFVRWSRVFGAINSKCDLDKCTELVLQMPEFKKNSDAQKNTILEDTLSCRLNLRNIQRIKIKALYNRFGLDFLLASKNSLEEMSLSCDNRYVHPKHGELKEKQVVDFLGFEENFQNSNIAKQFSQLKKIEVRVSSRATRRFSIQPNRVVQ